MKVVILAGGLGRRLSELTKITPKPMVKIGPFPIVIHIMNHYLNYGFNDFILATGYKSYVFKRYERHIISPAYFSKSICFHVNHLSIILRFILDK